MISTCALCDGACEGADLGPLLEPHLSWLWSQIARAGDRRGDADLLVGSLAVEVPNAAEERAAAAGLLGGRTLKQGQRRTLDFAQLTKKVRVRGALLTPGAIAAHSRGSPLAARAADEERRKRDEGNLMNVFWEGTPSLPFLLEPAKIWAGLRRAGWVARILAAETGADLLRSAVAVVAALPTAGARADRRRVATEVTGNPHALDHGSGLGGLVLGILVAGGRIGARQRPREAWASVGVDCDDLVGGLTAIGILPAEWTARSGAAVTVPPRELKTCEWPKAEVTDSWVFVTENPSVASVAADLAMNGTPVRLLCMNGTPSMIEIAAMARLAPCGWKVAVRADFDPAGIAHVNAVLGVVPDARAWRMSTADYLQSLRGEAPIGARIDSIPDAGWDDQLAPVMREMGVPSYEESLMTVLIDDLRQGRPGSS